MAAQLLKQIRKRFSKIRKSNVSYFIQENVIQGYGDLKSIVNPLPDVKPIKAGKHFSLNEIPLNEVTVKKLKEKYGTPSMVLKNDHNIENHIIYFYRQKVGYYKILIQFHFIGKHFFFASNRISIPKGLSVERKNHIVKQAFAKYTGQEPKEIKSFDIKLIDEKGNVLFINDYVSFYLNYLVENNVKKQIYHELWEDTEEHKEKVEIKVDFEKYI